MAVQLTQQIQARWPLLEQRDLKSVFERRIFSHLLIMGYDAVQHYDSCYGLHYIDIALLPSAKVPCKLAIEADGKLHFLYEDVRLGKSPNPAVRYIHTSVAKAHTMRA